MKTMQTTTETKFHLLHRTGGVWDMFIGTLQDAHSECDRRNKNDEGGSTVIHASFNDREEAESEFDSFNT